MDMFNLNNGECLLIQICTCKKVIEEDNINIEIDIIRIDDGNIFEFIYTVSDFAYSFEFIDQVDGANSAKKERLSTSS